MQTIQEAKALNKSVGGHFFDRSAMRFFNSKIESKLIEGKFFITSERYDLDTPKRYTIRKINEFGQVSDVGNFQEFESLEDALIALGRALALC